MALTTIENDGTKVAIRLLTMQNCLHAEIGGLRMVRHSVYAQVKRELGFKGNKKRVQAQLDAHIKDTLGEESFDARVARDEAAVRDPFRAVVDGFLWALKSPQGSPEMVTAYRYTERYIRQAPPETGFVSHTDDGNPLEVCERVKEAQAIALEEFDPIVFPSYAAPRTTTPDTSGHHPKKADTVRESV